MNEEYEYDFMRNQNYHYLAVTKPTALFGKFLSKHYGDKFRLSCFWNFQGN